MDFLFADLFLPALVAGIAAFLFGAVWYTLFSKPWMAWSRIGPDQMKAGKMTYGVNMALGFVSFVVKAYVFALFVVATGSYELATALPLAALVWFGFRATEGLGVVIWEMKTWKLYWLNAAHDLVSFLIMGAVLAAFL